MNSVNINKDILQNMIIMYIEDEENIRVNVTKTLELLCKSVESFSNSEAALHFLKKNHIDIIISDINLPKMSGIEFSKTIRDLDLNIPIILLTAHTDTKFLLEATKLKLIDYLTKPINFDNLHQALQRSCQDILDNSRYIINFPNLTVYNIQQKSLSLNNVNIALTNKEILLLEYLIRHIHRVVLYDELKEYVWEDSIDATESALKNVLNKLRKKIGKDTIQNISGVGYRLIL